MSNCDKSLSEEGMTDLAHLVQRNKRLRAAVGHAERKGQVGETVQLSLKLIRAWKRQDNFAQTRRMATQRALVLIKTAPQSKDVRRFWKPHALGRELVPLLHAQIAMFSAADATRTVTVDRRRRRPQLPPSETEIDYYTVLALVLHHISYIADIRALACVCKNGRDAVAVFSCIRTRRATPLCWCDVVACYRHGLRVLLPGGDTLATRRVKSELASGACFVSEHTDVFECMLRAYAAGKVRAELVACDADARNLGNAEKDVSVWIAAFGCSLAEGDVAACSHLLNTAQNVRLKREGFLALRASM